jgi:hypothetical protein
MQENFQKSCISFLNTKANKRARLFIAWLFSVFIIPVNKPGRNGMDALQPGNAFALLRRFNLGGEDAGAFGGGSYLFNIEDRIPGGILPGRFLPALAHLQ